jgi:hypothetical protein
VIIALLIIGGCLIGYIITRFLESKESKEAGIVLEQCPYKIESPESTSFENKQND